MKGKQTNSWSGSAITAKVFIPVILSIVVEIIFVPIHDAWTAAWIFLVVAPIAAAAIWLFANVGEIRSSSSNGLLYRKWVRWRLIQMEEVSNVVRVFPCFGAILLVDKSKLFFFPDNKTRRAIESLSHHGSTICNSPRRPTRAVFVRHLLAFLAGLAIGAAIQQTNRLAGSSHYSEATTALSRYESHYAPALVGVSIVYLGILALIGRISGRGLDISLGLIGMGIVYVSGVIFHLS